VTAPILIVGAGQAGVQAAEALRAGGHEGPVLLLGGEAHAPYHRPPLSKAYLLGETTPAQLALRSAEALARKGIELHTGTTVAAIDRAAQRIELDDGRRLDYAGLCLATGARARPLALPGAQLRGVVTLRSLDDARAIAQALPAARRVVVVGGGFIGLEFAAVARKLGKEVRVLEAAERLMARAVAPQLSDFYALLHQQEGVRIDCKAQVECLVDDGHGAVSGARTKDGRELPAELVLIGVGALPNIELAQAAGLECEQGIVVDACSRSADPRIVAAGDCAVRRQPDGRLLRLESVQNAVEQGRSAAAALLGTERPFVAAPWFWSDQYDVKLQMAGLSAGHDQVVVRGEPVRRQFSAFYYREGRLIAVDSINRSADHLPARRLLDQGISPSLEQAADPAFSLASLLA
jgi:3-phenylpropionate/trans-cinnamate dioxygenase ferredoxin reductase subunit